MSKAQIKYYKKNRDEILAKRKAKRDVGYYTVYYLPKEHYCGITKMNVEYRMHQHKSKGKNVEGWRVMFCSEDKLEAYHYESLYHGVLGVNGLLINNK